MEAKRHRNFAMTLAGVLLILVLVTTFLVSDMLAKFATGDRGEEISRVAKFSVSGDGLTRTIDLGVMMKPGDSETKSFVISNNSEVTVEYVVTLRNMTNNLPLKLDVTGEDDATKLAKFSTEEGYSYTATLAPNSGSTDNFVFKIEWPVDETTTPHTNDIVYSGQLDNIAVTVTATQID